MYIVVMVTMWNRFDSDTLLYVLVVVNDNTIFFLLHNVFFATKIFFAARSVCT